MKRPAIALLVIFASVGHARAQSVVINEFMANNSTTIQDKYGDYSDWIELYNPSAFSVDLDGWHLTDAMANPTRWVFPAVVIESDTYMLIFASSRDLVDPLGELHTNFKLSTNGEYLALVQPDGTTIEHEFAPAYPPQTPDVPFSYGLMPDGSREVFLAPTPMADNVPEPSSLVLLGITLAGFVVAFAGRRRAK